MSLGYSALAREERCEILPCTGYPVSAGELPVTAPLEENLVVAQEALVVLQVVAVVLGRCKAASVHPLLVLPNPQRLVHAVLLDGTARAVQ